MEWKYGKMQGKGLPPGISLFDDEKFSMREFGLWTVNGAQNELDKEKEEGIGELPRARITKDLLVDE